jgi:CRISPR-associated protein Csb2
VFPSVTPESPIVQFSWADTQPDQGTLDALSAMLSRLSYLGHSSSLVRAAIGTRCLDSTWQPGDPGSGAQVMRVPCAGFLARLEEQYEVFVATGVPQDLVGRYQAYRRPSPLEPQTPASVFDRMIILRRAAGTKLPIVAAERVAKRLRDAAISRCDQPVPESLSGHRPDRTPSSRPHVAFVGLPAVGHRHLDGNLLGVAAILPRDLDATDRGRIERALVSVPHLTLGAAGVWDLAHALPDEDTAALRHGTWAREADCWVTVTPLELDGFPDGGLHGDEAQAMVSRACQRIGLPAPVSVLLGPHTIVLGSQPVAQFRRHRLQPTGRQAWPLVHAMVTFERPVRGPVLLGAGRYRGLGLCRPHQPRRLAWG